MTNTNLKTSNLVSKRTKCAVYTRVMGYLRPVSFFNKWKKSEFYSRKYFNHTKSMNSNFENEFGKSDLISSWDTLECKTISV